MKNSLYLKKYVQLHPDNKMGWYLLGKEYENDGQQGKANYCFNQSGGIYEAFETSKMPSDIWIEYESKLLQQARDSDRRSHIVRRVLAALMIVFLVIVPSVDAPGDGTQEEVAVQPKVSDNGYHDANLPVQSMQGGGANPIDERPAAAGSTVFTAQADGSIEGRSKLLSNQLSHPGRIAEKVAVLGMKRHGDWLVWQRNLPVNYTLEPKRDGVIAYQSYNEKECDCKPLIDGVIKAAAEDWTQEQEELALLNSAIRSYQNMKGTLPRSLDDLLRPFPDNWISGSTDRMQNVFEPLLDQFRNGGEGSADYSVGGVPGKNSIPQSPFASTWGHQPFLKEPLKIIVDKQSHRLAVVSGGIMLRSYKVGLGGMRTPEGDYAISTKVMNPNGRDNGEFGSRGMQLSDTNYAIHGTNEPESVGFDVSKGCIRMRKADIEELFDLVPMGTPVHISKGVLPDDLLAPKERFLTKREQNQTNPHKTYHWL